MQIMQVMHLEPKVSIHFFCSFHVSYTRAFVLNNNGFEWVFFHSAFSIDCLIQLFSYILQASRRGIILSSAFCSSASELVLVCTQGVCRGPSLAYAIV